MTKFERLLKNSKPIKFVVGHSKRLVFPGFEGLPFFDVAKFFVSQVNRVGLRDRATAIAFNFILAIPATAIFLFTLLPYFPSAKIIQKELYIFIGDVTPNSESRKLILSTLDELFNQPKKGLLSIGFLLALFYSSNAVMGMIRTFDASLILKKKGNFLIKRWRAIRITIILVMMLLATVILSIGQGIAFTSLLKWMGLTKSVDATFLTETIRLTIVVFLFLFSVAFIYKYAPSVHKRWKLFSPGAIFATALILLNTWLFSIWAQNFSTYNRIYGSIGALMVIMVLIFINSLMLLVGYELNVSISHLKVEAEERRLKEEGGGIIS